MGPLHSALCVDLFVFICDEYFVCFVSYFVVAVLLWTLWGRPDGIEPSGPIFLQCFDTVGWVIWPVKPVPIWKCVWWDVKRCSIYLSSIIFAADLKPFDACNVQITYQLQLVAIWTPDYFVLACNAAK